MPAGLSEIRVCHGTDNEDRLLDARLAQREGLAGREDSEAQPLDAGPRQCLRYGQQPVTIPVRLYDRTEGRWVGFASEGSGIRDKGRTVDFEPRMGVNHEAGRPGRNHLSKPEPPAILGLALECLDC